MNWTEALAEIGTKGPVGLILYIGSGSGVPFADGVGEAIDRVVLVDPHPALRKTLKKAGGRDSRIRTFSAAIADESGSAGFRVFNAPHYSSLSAPSGLREMLPGLRENMVVPVETLSPADLIARIGEPERDRHNVLILDAPGAERFVLTGLLECGVLTAFDMILLRTGNKVQFKDGWAAEDCLQLLASQVYRPTALTGEDDALRQYSLRRDPVEVERRATADEISTLKSGLARAEAEAEASRVDFLSRIDRQEAELAELRETAALLPEKEARIATLEAEVSALATVQRDLIEAERRFEEAERTNRSREADLQSEALACTAELAAARERSSILESELQSSRTTAEKRDSELADVRAQLDQLQQESRDRRADLEGEVEKRTADLATAREERDKARQRIGTLETDLKNARTTVEKRDSELADVRAQLDQLQQESRARQADLRSEALARTAELAAACEERDTAREKVDALEVSQKSLNQSLSAAKDGAAEAEARADRMETELKTANAEVERHRAELSIALRLQLLAKSDLGELREQYAEMQRIKAAQEALLLKLQPRLQEAAAYLRHSRESGKAGGAGTLAPPESGTTALPKKARQAAKAGAAQSRKNSRRKTSS